MGKNTDKLIINVDNQLHLMKVAFTNYSEDVRIALKTPEFDCGVSMAAFHRLIPIGVGGFLMNVTTGFCFLCGTPDQYFLNRAFQFKMTFLLIAGLNMAMFYLTMFRTVRAMGPGDLAPVPARIIGGISLAAWIGVMTCGRLLTFFRPV